MAEQLGRIERPSLEAYRGKRKLLLVPVLALPPDDAEDGIAIVGKYWEQVQTQVTSLELRLGWVKHVYHETLPEGGDEGLKILEASGEQGSYALAQTRCQAGAVLEAAEDAETLMETMDLQRCLMLPFASPRVAAQLQQWMADAVRRRNEHFTERIDETLSEDEVGLLLVGERHQLQFPQDIEVFYVAPPALDEYRRWVDAWLARQRAAQAEEGDGEEAEDAS
jgi:hypothetical protein